MQALVTGAATLGITLNAHQVAQFELYRRELLAWNDRVNLTAITDPEEVLTKHFLDSLTVELALGPEMAGAKAIDVGSGAGFPGIPLKIVHPELALTLLEATNKKAAFLKHVLESLMLLDVEVVTMRAEDAARLPEHREVYALVLARAVAAMAVLAEITLPLCRIGGMVVAPKKGPIADEIAQAEAPVAALGGRFWDILDVEAPGLEDGRHLVVLEKIAPTPQRYPRRPGIPQKQPFSTRALKIEQTAPGRAAHG